MIDNPNNIRFKWQDILWRLLLTGLLLLGLAGSGLTIFNTAKTGPDSQVLPTSIYDTEAGR